MAALATLGIAAFVYRSLLGNVLVRRRTYRVVAVNRLDEFVTEIVMEPRRASRSPSSRGSSSSSTSARSRCAGAPPVRGLGRARRSSPSAPGEIAQPVPPVLDHLRAGRADAADHGQGGRRLHARAALARGRRRGRRRRPVRLLLAPERRRTDRQIWMAGGIGVTPFLSMARSLGDGDAARRRLLLLRRARRRRRTSSTSSARSPRAATTSASSLVPRDTRRLPDGRARSPRSTPTSAPRTCSSAGRPR